jgi:hypothetical protein
MDSRNTNAELHAEADAIARRIVNGQATASDASTVVELSNRLMRCEPRAALAAPSADRAAAPVGQPAAQAVEVRKEDGK